LATTESQNPYITAKELGIGRLAKKALMGFAEELHGKEGVCVIE
jgi:hypothetical protein